MPARNDADRSLIASIAAHESWANTSDRTAAGGDPIRADHLRKAHFRRLALKSAAARRRAREAMEAADEADAELALGAGDVGVTP